MRKSRIPLLLSALGLVGFLGLVIWGLLLYGWLWTDSPHFIKYKQIKVGMSIEEVEAILGPGTPVKQAEVPTIRIAVNPKDAEAAAERDRKTGSPSTVREYPTRSKPVVEGDCILQWTGEPNGVRILVAFKNGKVCEKDYFEYDL